MKNKKLLINILSSILVTLLLLTGCSSDNTTENTNQITQQTEVENQNKNLEKQQNDLSEDKTGKSRSKSEDKTETNDTKGNKKQNTAKAEKSIDEDGEYTSKEEVALYIHIFGKLPSNYVTKKEAQEKGWDSKAGNLDAVLPGKSIGGDKFGNREEILPTAKGRKYYECDINHTGGHRNAERIVYSNDGLVFYTKDHYKTFEQLY